MNTHSVSSNSAVSLARAVRLGLGAISLALLVLLVLRYFTLGCEPLTCSARGLRFGLPLGLGGLLLAVPGALLLGWLASAGVGRPPFRLFSSMTAGLAVTMAYVFFRSAFNEFVWNIPVTRWELLAGWVLCAAVLIQRRRSRPLNDNIAETREASSWPWLETIFFLVMCVVIADRELPRIAMLSSDPDFHVFFGLQVERSGGIPYHQHGWGEQPFNYTAGSGVLLFLWKMFSGLDTRNILTALPLLFVQMAALVVVEHAMPARLTTVQRLVGYLMALAMASAGFMFPLYAQYAHMESSARQMSILFAGLFVAGCIHALRHPDAPPRRWGLTALAVFALMVLNPANVAVPGAIAAAAAVYTMWKRCNPVAPLAAFLGGFALGFLDPFYQKLVSYTQGARIDTVTYGSALVVKSREQILHDTMQQFAHDVPPFSQEVVRLFGDRSGVFLMLVLAFSLAYWLLPPRRSLNKPALGAALVLLLGLYAIHALTHALGNDVRTFLLAPYVSFILVQFKAMALVALAGLVLGKLVQAQRNRFWLILASVLLVWPVSRLVRSEQDMLLDPRRGYCGAFECIADADLQLLGSFERLVAEGALTRPGEAPPKVLLPNNVSHMELETWIFPVDSARILPYYNVLPAAFYYYQGDAQYSTSSYVAHVCNQFDRRWLEEKGIRYLFLPTVREEACVAGMKDLIHTEEVVLNVQGAYLLKLKPSLSDDGAGLSR